MPLIELHPDFSKLVTQLTRVADALEVIVSHQYGVSLRPSHPDKRPDDAEVLYPDDIAQLKDELATLEGRPPKLPDEDEG